MSSLIKDFALIKDLKGPICVLGGTGFIGTNLYNYIRAHRDDVHCSKSADMWTMLDRVHPQTVFNCIAYGAYSYQGASSLIYHTNFILTEHLLSHLSARGFHTYVHAGTSAEYGIRKALPSEDSALLPMTPYGVSKVAASGLVHYYGKTLGKRVCNLRLYCAYGPYEKYIKLVPTIILEAIRYKRLPEFVRGDISRDFIHVEDVCRAFVTAAVKLKESHYGESFNVGTGTKTTISEVAQLARATFGLAEEPRYTMPSRDWDTAEDWRARTDKARDVLGYTSEISFEDGFTRTADWFRNNVRK